MKVILKNKQVLIILILFIFCYLQVSAQEKPLTDFVKPFIGISRGGNQSPGPLYPFGMIHLSPINVARITPTYYLAGKTSFYGVGLINLVGTGCSNFGNVIVLPDNQKPTFKNEFVKLLNDSASAGYYACKLDKEISIEMTDLTRSGIMKIDFGPNKQKFLKIDLTRLNSEDSTFIVRKESNTISGCRDDGQFCGKPGNTRVYYYFVIPGITENNITLVKNRVETNEKEISVKRDSIGAIIDLSDTKNAVEIKVGISFVSVENAKMNLEKELVDKSFIQVLAENKMAWESKLNQIQVEGGTKNDKIKFYTALYHTMSHPNILNDVNGEYPSMEKMKTMKKTSGSRYTLFSLWDTYRNLHPFMSLVYPEQQSDMVKSMIDMYNEYGWLPHWECFSKEKGVMNGDPACVVINDTYQRGIRDFDVETAYKAMIHNSKVVYTTEKERDRKNVEYVRKAIKPYWENKGYIPAEYRKNGGDIWGTVSTTLEYNFADWNIAQLAKTLGKTDDYSTYSTMSDRWQILFDAKTGFLRQCNSDGTWVEPFDDKQTLGEMPWPGSGGPGFVEGNAHNYNFFVPHALPKLIELLGGEKKFANRLQKMFDNKLYEPTNEPDIAYPFLFNYAKGEEWRTQKTVRSLIESEYSTGFDGIPGNDDTGTMSAWLLYAMMGFYPDCPGKMDYQISSPVFKKITIHLDSKYYKGKKFVIETKNGNAKNIFIKSMKLNGVKLTNYQLTHEQIVNGGKLTIGFSDKHL